MKASDSLFPLVQSFFCDHLKKVRGASPHTVAAYRDAMRLFLQFLADRRGLPVARLQLTDLEVEAVAGFLQHLEEQRHNSIATRNCRRIALRAFFQHALRQDPSRANQFARVLALPPKRCTQPLPRSLEPSQMRRLLAQPNRRTLSGQRDYALLLFLYNTGVRISEAVAVCRRDLQFVVPYHVRVQGKGGKARFCPLWPTTMAALKPLLTHRPDPAEPLFHSCRRTPLTRHGAQYVLTKYATMANHVDPSFPSRISPHMLRHSCACALLQAGVDLTVIRDYLGHASIATTSRYANSNLKLKRAALESFWEHAGLATPHIPPWRPRKSLLNFLSSV